jgi:hypothetical protein
VELGEVGGVHGYVVLINGDTEPAQELLERGLEGAPPGAAALLKAEVNAHLGRDSGQRVRARFREEAALAQVDAELGLERHEHIHATHHLAELLEPGREARCRTGPGAVGFKPGRSGGSRPHTGGGRVGVGTRERERERESEGMVGDGSHEEIRSFFFVSVGSGSELFFLTAQLDVFQSNSKWNGDTSFYFPPQLNTSLITKESSTCCYEGPDGESVCVWESDLVNQIL